MNAGGQPEGGSAVFLLSGELVLAEPAAGRVAAALAATAGCEVEVHRRPPQLAPLFQDLRTYSLFSAAKVLLVVDSAVLADRSAAAELIDDAGEALPLADPDRDLSGRERLAASRLLQALHLFDIDPQAGEPAAAIDSLPAWVLEGGRAAGGKSGKGAKRGKRQLEELRAGLASLLAAARREELQGFGGGAVAELAAMIREGLPAGHSLVLAERAVAADHPVVALLAERGAVVRVGELEAGRGGAWEGVDLLAAELERQTGVAIAKDALAELARRTLRQEGDWKKGGSGAAGADGDSTARFAGEYRKLANLTQRPRAAAGASAGKIDRKLVASMVEDRGEEDVWQLLDAVAAGRVDEALDRLSRLLGSAEDPMAARLSFFSLFASFCRQLTAIRGMMRLMRVPAGEANYPRFKDRHAPALQGDIDLGIGAQEGKKGGAKNPLAGLHPYRLHRAYLAASKIPEVLLAKLPAEVLEAEMRLKGESSEADTALAYLISRVAAAARAS